MKRGALITNSCIFLLVVLFVYTAVTKLLVFSRFLYQLELFPWIGPYSIYVAWSVILTELGVVCLLLGPRRPRYGFLASLGLLSLFTLYLLIMIGTQPHLPCTCGGVIEQLTWPQHIFFNLFFIGVSILGLRSSVHH